MRWLLCGGDGSKEKTTSVITEKFSREKIYLHYSFILIRKNLNRIKLQSLQFYINSKN